MNRTDPSGTTTSLWRASVLVLMLAVAMPQVVRAQQPAAEQTQPSEAQLLQALKQAEADDVGDGKALLKPLEALVKLYSGAGRFNDALATAQRLLSLEEKVYGPEHAEVAGTLGTFGKLYWSMGRFADALSLSRRSLSIFEKAHGPDHQSVATSLHNLATIYKDMGEYAEALPLFRRSLAINETAHGPNHPNVASSLNGLALLHQDMGQYAEALPLLRRSLAIREKALGSHHPLVATGLSNLALLYWRMGQYAEATPLSRRSLVIREEVLGPEHPAVAISLNNLATLHQATSQYAEALPLYQRGLTILERALGPEHPDVATSLGNLASGYRHMGQYSEALPLYRRSLAINEKALGPEHPAVATSLNNLSSLYRDMGQYVEALPLCGRSLAIFEKVHGPEHPAVASSLNNLAALYSEMGRTGEALPLYRRSLMIRENALGPEHPSVAESLNNLASLALTQGDRAAALPYYLRAERIAAAAGDRETLWRIQIGLREVHSRSGQPTLAIFWGKQSVNTIQALRGGLSKLDRELQQSFLVNKRSAYTGLSDLLIREGRLIEAQQVMAMLREEEFFDFVRRDGAADARATPIPLTGVERVAHERFYAIRERLAALSAEKTALEGKAKYGLASAAERQRLAAIEPDLVAARTAFDAFVGGLAQLLADDGASARRTEAVVGQIESHQNLLADLGPAGQGVAAVQYVVGEQRLHIIVSTAGVQLAREVALPREELNRRIADLRQVLQNPRADPRPRARALGAQLIGPIAADLQAQGIHTLLLFLDGALRYLPFAALMQGEKYLLEDYRLAIYTEAARSRLGVAPQARWAVGAFGVSRGFPEQNFGPLAAVPAELKDVTAVLPGSPRLDGDFDRDALVAGLGNPVLHIASHFRFVAGSDESFLLLGDGGRLTLRQVRTELPRLTAVDLLTLSACETAVGGGRNENGVEVEGLGVLAQKQGARAVLATLWAVADASTGQLMQQFYQARLGGPVNKAEALRQAQLRLLNGTATPTAATPAADVGEARGASRPSTGADAPPFTPDPTKPYAHPYFWAPFILMGNWL